MGFAGNGHSCGRDRSPSFQLVTGKVVKTDSGCGRDGFVKKANGSRLSFEPIVYSAEHFGEQNTRSPLRGVHGEMMTPEQPEREHRSLMVHEFEEHLESIEERRC